MTVTRFINFVRHFVLWKPGDDGGSPISSQGANHVNRRDLSGFQVPVCIASVHGILTLRCLLQHHVLELFSDRRLRVTECDLTERTWLSAPFSIGWDRDDG